MVIERNSIDEGDTGYCELPLEAEVPLDIVLTGRVASIRASRRSRSKSASDSEHLPSVAQVQRPCRARCQLKEARDLVPPSERFQCDPFCAEREHRNR